MRKTKMRRKFLSFSTLVPALAPALVLASALAACGPDVSEGGKAVPPKGSPAALIQAACTRCHPMAKVCAAVGRLDADAWAQTISRMVQKGAVLNPNQVAPLAAYLTVRGEEIKPYCKE
ncbi:MAG: hypothetical protein AB7D57_01075 [Desulfovibrionaceae bacterium]